MRICAVIEGSCRLGGFKFAVSPDRSEIFDIDGSICVELHDEDLVEWGTKNAQSRVLYQNLASIHLKSVRQESYRCIVQSFWGQAMM
jgi:hypothetical protein